MTEPRDDRSTSTSTAVTTSVARRITPGREQDFVAWTDAGISVLRTFDGFLGGGWLRSSTDPHEYYVLYRFDSDAHLQEWLSSSFRRAWVARGVGVADDHVTHRLTGVEGWFEPQSTLTDAVRVVGAPPPRWKQAIVIWSAFFPLSLLLNTLVSEYLSVGLVLRTLLVTLVSTPLMVYVLLPFITARVKRWLTP